MTEIRGFVLSLRFGTGWTTAAPGACLPESDLSRQPWLLSADLQIPENEKGPRTSATPIISS